MTAENIEIAEDSETGNLEIMHLKRFWDKCILKRGNKLPPNALQQEWQIDVIMLNALGLGLEPTLQYIYRETSSFEDFENWIVEVTRGPAPPKKLRILMPH